MARGHHRAWLAVALPIAFIAGAAQAGDVVGYRDRADWLTAIVDFDGSDGFGRFVVDTEFEKAPLILRGNSLMAVNGTTALGGFRNFVDVRPYVYDDNNGTKHASIWTNFGGVAGDPPVTVTITLNQPAVAWGADFFGAATAETLVVDVLDKGGRVIGTMTGLSSHSKDPEFMGFIATPDNPIATVVLRSERDFLGTGGEGFGMDDVMVKFASRGSACKADCDTSTGAGVLDFFDFICFQEMFDELEPYACECDRSTGVRTCDFFDFICYQELFASGC